LFASGMLSKRRRQGKPRNILLAMPHARFLTRKFHPAKFTAEARAAWLMNRKKDSSSPEPQPIVVGATFTLNYDGGSPITSI
jgi:hypothetical protein